jgi:NAD(P)-dependent dehydrogenase (short-subunit alcohol dehydrogenase family)
MRLEGKIAIVTGAGRGIGRAIAELFGEHGAIVYAADVHDGGYSAANVHPRSLDVSREEDWTALLDEVVQQHGRVDVLVNNAGVVVTFEALADVSPEDWERVFAVNLTGTFLGMRAVVPIMGGNSSGSIINICSTVALTGTPSMGPYAATKGGIRALSANGAVTYADRGIRVNTIFPGVIDTNLLGTADEAALEIVLAVTPMGRVGQPSEIAYGALFFASNESSYVTGAELVIDGGFVAK